MLHYIWVFTVKVTVQGFCIQGIRVAPSTRLYPVTPNSTGWIWFKFIMQKRKIQTRDTLTNCHFNPSTPVPLNITSTQNYVNYFFKCQISAEKDSKTQAPLYIQKILLTKSKLRSHLNGHADTHTCFLNRWVYIWSVSIIIPVGYAGVFWHIKIQVNCQDQVNWYCAGASTLLNFRLSLTE